MVVVSLAGQHDNAMPEELANKPSRNKIAEEDKKKVANPSDQWVHLALAINKAYQLREQKNVLGK